MKKICVLIILLQSWGCISTEELYRKGVADASHPTREEIVYDLTPIVSTNSRLCTQTIKNKYYVLAVSWKADSSRYKNDAVTGYYNTDSNRIWVTVVPELSDFIRENRLVFPRDTLRLKQLLGLPPGRKYAYVVEFWVQPEDLFRPCPDAEIDDSSCKIYFPENTACDHYAFIENNRRESYSDTIDVYKNFPWSQLGYTYDWNKKSKTHVGLSEFVIDTNSNIIVRKTYTTEEYFNGMNGNPLPKGEK